MARTRSSSADKPFVLNVSLNSAQRIVIVSALSEQAMRFFRMAQKDEDRRDYWLFRRSENIRIMMELRGNERE